MIGVFLAGLECGYILFILAAGVLGEYYSFVAGCPLSNYFAVLVKYLYLSAGNFLGSCSVGL